jgi:hypothetical protein
MVRKLLRSLHTNLGPHASALWIASIPGNASSQVLAEHVLDFMIYSSSSSSSTPSLAPETTSLRLRKVSPLTEEEDCNLLMTRPEVKVKFALTSPYERSRDQGVELVISAKVPIDYDVARLLCATKALRKIEQKTTLKEVLTLIASDVSPSGDTLFGSAVQQLQENGQSIDAQLLKRKRQGFGGLFLNLTSLLAPALSKS